MRNYLIAVRPLTFIPCFKFRVRELGHLGIVVDAFADGFVKFHNDTPSVDLRLALGLDQNFRL